MKRRAFITALFCTAAVTIAAPAQAFSRRRRGRIRSRTNRSRSYKPVSSQSKPVRRDFAQSRSRPAPPDPYTATRSTNGRLTEANIRNFRREYADGQSRQAMRSALGQPAEHTFNKDRWRIQRTDIYGKPAEDGWFEADYGLTGWHLDSKTTRPPKANW